MIKPIFDELAAPRPKRHFTVGIYDDVTHLSLPIDGAFRRRTPGGRGPGGLLRARLGRHGRRQQGVGQDHRREHGPVRPGLLRVRLQEVGLGHGVAPALRAASRSARRISSTDADFVACHQFGLLGKMKVLESAKHGATFLLNAPYGPDEVWDHLPGEVQRQLIDKGIDFWVIDAARGRRRGRDGQPDQHGHAAVLLPARRASCRPTRRSPGSRRSSRRPTPSAATRSSSATSPPSTVRWRGSVT